VCAVGAFCFVVFKEPDFIECVFRLAHYSEFAILFYLARVVDKWRWEFNFVDGRRREAAAALVFGANNAAKMHTKAFCVYMYVCGHGS
jgi:hypothetical protein